MPDPKQLAHRHISATNLPYISNLNPTQTDPCYVAGSQDVLTTIAGYAERRLGFADNVEVTPTTFVNAKRIFSWDRTDGTFIQMACDINGSSQAVVYKRVIGTDNSFVSIFTDTGSSTAFDFVVSNNTIYFSNGSTARKWDPTNGLSNWGITAPAAAPVVATVAGTLVANIGYQYVVCYHNSASGHVSSPSPKSAVIVPATQGVQVTLVAAADAQVTGIKVFRTTDSVATGTNGATFLEITSSPFTNTNQNITDNTADTALNISSIAPTPTFNDPPPAMQALVYFSGRVWGFSGSKVFFSGLEEIITGTPEEAFPSGTAGNFWRFDQPVQALAVAGDVPNQTLVIFCGGRIYGITGNTLDTFRRFLLTKRRGCRAVTCISELGGMVAWLDSSNTIWGTDGGSLKDLSTDIRPDLASVTPANCSMTFHVAGRFHWLVFSTGAKLFVYDMDTEQWMPPWTFVCQYVYSGEVSAGAYKLMAMTATKALQLSATAHNDNGASYTLIAQTNLFSVVPDFGRRFSTVGVGSYDEPTRTGTPYFFQVDSNSVTLQDVGFAADEDPTLATTIYTSIFAQRTGPETAFNRSNGINLVQSIFAMTRPNARWISFQIKGQAADDALKIYGFFLAYRQFR